MAGEVNVGALQAALVLVDEMSNPASRIGQALKQLEQNVGAADRSVDKLDKTMKESGTTLTAWGVMLANLASNYIARATDALIAFGKEAVTTAAEAKMLGHVAEFMGAKYGMSKDQVHAFVEALNKQGISIKQSNDTVIQFAKSQLDLGKATQLAALAQSAARIGNMNSSQALSRLIHGIQTQQTETLRTVGITISMERATKEYAQTLGKNVDSLTAAERQQAAFNAVLKEGEKINGVYGVTMKDAAGKLQSMTRLIEDAKVKIGEAFQPAFEKAVDILYQFWKAVGEAPEKFLAFGAAIAFVGTALYVSWFLPVTAALVALDLLVGAFTGTLDPIENFKSLLVFVGGILEGFDDLIFEATGGVVDFGTALKNLNMLGDGLKLFWLSLVEGFAKVSVGLNAMGAQLIHFLIKGKELEKFTVSGMFRKDAIDKEIAGLRQMEFELGKNADAMAGLHDRTLKETEALINGTDATNTHGKAKKSLEDRLKEGAAAWAAHLKQLEAAKEKEEKAAAAAERHKRAIEMAAQAYVNAQHQFKALDLGKDSGFVMPKFDEIVPMKADIQQIAEGSWKAAAGISKTALELSRAGVPAATIAAKLQAAGLSSDQIATIMTQVNTQLVAARVASQSWGNVLKTSIGDALKKLPQVILGAIQGGGDVFKSIGASIGGDLGTSLGKKAAEAIGGKLGSALGSLAGPLGSIAGSLLGGLVDKLGLFGNKAIMETNRARDAFFKLQGGWEQFQKTMAKVSSQDWAKKIFDAKTVEEFNALVKEAQRLLDLPAEAMNKLNTAMEKYGITVDQLGPKMRQQKLDEQALQLFQDWQLLIGAGVDINVLIEKMGPNMMEYVNTAVQAGSTIPQAMKPVIDALYANGQLLHENGEAFTEAEYQALQYGTTQAEMFDTLIDKITQLVNALLGIPTDINTNVTTTHRERYERGDAGDVPMASGGIITRPTRILAGEAGPEAIIPLRAGGLGGSSEISDASISRLERSLSKVFRDAILQSPR